jgi:hypothetical protein
MELDMKDMNCICSRPKSDCAGCSVYQAQNNLGKEYWNGPEDKALKTCFCTREDGDCEKCRGDYFQAHSPTAELISRAKPGDSTEEHF